MTVTSTEWFDHAAVDISHTVNNGKAAVPQAGLIHPQWEDAPGGIARTSAIIDGSLSDGVILEMQNTLMGSAVPGTEFARVFYDNNWAIESHWTWLDTYYTRYSMSVAVLPIVEDDGYTWRQTRASELAEQYEADHPGSFVTSFAWEGDDGTTQLGSHTARYLALTYHGFEPDFNKYVEGTGDLYRREDYASPPNPPLLNPPEPDIKFYAAPISLGVAPPSPDPVPWYDGAGTNTSLTRYRWVPRDLLDGSPLIGSLPSVLGEYTIPIDDAIFEANAEPLVNFSASYRHSRGMVMIGIPRIEDIVDPEAHYDAAATAYNLKLWSTYQPPRYRMNYVRVEAPYRRSYPPRHDGLSGGARRNYPASNTVQTGNRNVGGCL